ncbi:MAG: long-chain-fatty-acid--CoA ligase [Pseudomonadota bacterium]
MNIVPDMMTFGRANHPERAAVIVDDKTLTFQAVDERADKLVAYFKQLGLKSEDRVALLAKNEAEYLEIQVAALRAKLVLVPLNFRLALPELEYIIDDCKPRALICGPEFREAAKTLPVEHGLILGEQYEAALSEVGVVATGIRPPLNADALACILYTSGTTGRPKGAVISNHALYARTNSMAFEYRATQDERFLQCLPMFHIASNVSYAYTFVGATSIYLKDFHPQAVLELVAKHRITLTLLVPTMINALINYPEVKDVDINSLRTVAYGASPIPPIVLKQAIDVLGCQFLQLFGMTETGPCTVLRPADHDPVNQPGRLAGAGTNSPDMEVRVVDDKDVDVPCGEVGEVICRGPGVMSYYWNAEAATADALRHGWMHTGDVGYQDSDGYYYITDRKKDMIVSGGENVYPREVEDVLYEHPDVLEAAVIGIPHERWGEQVHAVLVPAAGVSLDSEKVLGYARSQLAGYKVPKSAEVMAELPKNATGKILKTELRSAWWEGKTRRI